MKIVDNFLPDNEFYKIKNEMEGRDFPWYWQSHSHGNVVDGKFIGDNVPQLIHGFVEDGDCLLYTSPSPRDRTRSRMPSSA